MPIRNNAFANPYERESFYKLQHTFGAYWNVFHNLPFLNVLEPSPQERRELGLTEDDFDYLKKTSIDYVVCDKTDKPIAAVEFDALRQGFNLDGRYESSVPDHRREKHMNLKIKVAEFFRFPFFVAGSDLFKEISPELKITFIEGMVGNVLAGYEVSRIMQSDDFKHAPTFSDNTGIDKYVALQCRLKKQHNPIYQKWSEIVGSYLSRPGALCKNEHFFFPRTSNFSEVTHVGVRCRVEIPSLGISEAEVWMPRYSLTGDSLSCGCFDLPETIAEILAVERLTKPKQRLKE